MGFRFGSAAAFLFTFCLAQVTAKTIIDSLLLTDYATQRPISGKETETWVVRLFEDETCGEPGNDHLHADERGDDSMIAEYRGNDMTVNDKKACQNAIRADQGTYVRPVKSVSVWISSTFSKGAIYAYSDFACETPVQEIWNTDKVTKAASENDHGSETLTCLRVTTEPLVATSFAFVPDADEDKRDHTSSQQEPDHLFTQGGRGAWKQSSKALAKTESADAEMIDDRGAWKHSPRAPEDSSAAESGSTQDDMDANGCSGNIIINTSENPKRRDQMDLRGFLFWIGLAFMISGAQIAGNPHFW